MLEEYEKQDGAALALAPAVCSDQLVVDSSRANVQNLSSEYGSKSEHRQAPQLPPRGQEDDRDPTREPAALS